MRAHASPRFLGFSGSFSAVERLGVNGVASQVRFAVNRKAVSPKAFFEASRDFRARPNSPSGDRVHTETFDTRGRRGTGDSILRDTFSSNHPRSKCDRHLLLARPTLVAPRLRSSPATSSHWALSRRRSFCSREETASLRDTNAHARLSADVA